MNIGIIGAGNLGTGLAKRLVARGHVVMLSFSRDAGKLQTIASSLGARTGTAAEAALFGDVVILSVPWAVVTQALGQVEKATTGKVLWDCTNALKSDLSGLVIGTNTSGGEEVAKLVPQARVVKAIPPFAEVLHSESVLVGGQKLGVFVAGDDDDARAVVAKLVEDIGAAPIKMGPLALARFIEPSCMLLVRLAYANGFGARLGLALQRDESP